MARPNLKQVGGLMSRNEWLITGGAVALSVVAGLLTAIHANAVLTFVVSGVALALLAALVGMGTEQIGSHLGPGATGVLQSSLGNLPELFVGYFALRSGLIAVIQAALVGSILGNSLLVLGLAPWDAALRFGSATHDRHADAAVGGCPGAADAGVFSAYTGSRTRGCL